MNATQLRELEEAGARKLVQYRLNAKVPHVFMANKADNQCAACAGPREALCHSNRQLSLLEQIDSQGKEASNDSPRRHSVRRKVAADQ